MAFEYNLDYKLFRDLCKKPECLSMCTLPSGKLSDCLFKVYGKAIENRNIRGRVLLYNISLETFNLRSLKEIWCEFYGGKYNDQLERVDIILPVTPELRPFDWCGLESLGKLCTFYREEEHRKHFQNQDDKILDNLNKFVNLCTKTHFSIWKTDREEPEQAGYAFAMYLYYIR